MAYLGHIMKDGMLTPYLSLLPHAPCSPPRIRLLPRAPGLEALCLLGTLAVLL